MDEIVKLLWQRNEDALHLMETQYAGFCSGIVMRLLGNIRDTEEAVNDIWLRVWNSIPPAKPKFFKAYLAKLSRNTALHYIEYNQAQKRSGITVLIDELSECIPDPHASKQLDTICIRDVLNKFVRSLHGSERTFFLRRYYFGDSIRDIAEANGCTENQVAVKLFRTRSKLKVLLEEEEIEI